MLLRDYTTDSSLQDSPAIYMLYTADGKHTYIGASRIVRNRLSKHLSNAFGTDLHNHNSKQKMYSTIRFIGSRHWYYTILAECKEEDLAEKEKELIAIYKPTLNSQHGSFWHPAGKYHKTSETALNEVLGEM
jgi:excinuclease UvrABC nuclease subunit